LFTPKKVTKGRRTAQTELLGRAIAEGRVDRAVKDAAEMPGASIAQRSILL